MGGYAGSILTVDLSKEEIERRPLDEELIGSFLGGFGVNIKLAYDLIKPGTDAFSPENPIILGAGPLVGTVAPGSSRIYAMAKLPANNTLGWAGAGGMSFGCMFKSAGYDHLIIKGRAAEPVYLKIFDEEVEIGDAGELWGKGVERTSDELWEKFGRPAGVISIGQAGENLVKFAMAFVDKTSTLGRGGFGAVMGSKNLKAIAVRGSRGVRVSDPKRFTKLCDEMFERMRKWPPLGEWHEFGFLTALPFFPRDWYLEVRKRRICCVSCPVGDKDVIQLEEPPLTRFTTSAVNMLTPMLWGLTYEEAIRCAAVLDDYGLDIFEFFGVLEFANRLYERGMIDGEGLGSRIEYSLPSLMEWAKKIAHREGFGGILAEGVGGMLRRFGREAERFAPPTVKGLTAYVGPSGPLVWDRLGTMEFDQLVNPRGPHAASGGSPTYFRVRPLEEFAPHLRRMGVPEEAVRRILPEARDWPWGERLGLVSPGERGLNVGRLTRYSEDWFTALASLGVCARGQINRFYHARLLAELYSAATGREVGAEEIMKAAERSWNLLRAANAREGFDRKDDAFPLAWLEGPRFAEYTGKVEITGEIAERFLDDYYEERGWSGRGIPTKEKLLDLGLKEAAEELERLGAYRQS